MQIDRSWLLRQMDWLDEIGRDIPGDPANADPVIQAGDSPAENVFEDAADLVRTVGAIIARTGWPEAAALHEESTKFAPATAPNNAITYLAKCLAACDKHVPIVEVDEDAIYAKEPPAHKIQAYMQYEQVMKVKPELSQEKAYWWYRNHMREPGETLIATADTWARHVRTVRKYYGESRDKSPRHGRGGPSIVSIRQIDTQDDSAFYLDGR